MLLVLIVFKSDSVRKYNFTNPGLIAAVGLTWPSWSAHEAITLADRRDLHSSQDPIFSPANVTELYFLHTTLTMSAVICLSGYIALYVSVRSWRSSESKFISL